MVHREFVVVVAVVVIVRHVLFGSCRGFNTRY
jgi:hypothetical protein